MKDHFGLWMHNEAGRRSVGGIAAEEGIGAGLPQSQEHPKGLSRSQQWWREEEDIPSSQWKQGISFLVDCGKQGMNIWIKKSDEFKSVIVGPEHINCGEVWLMFSMPFDEWDSR